MTGDPPIGTENAFPKEDPDETPEMRRARLGSQQPMPEPTTMTGGAQDRADAIVRRESGVADFADATEADHAGGYQIEDYPGQDDPSSPANVRRGDPLNAAPGETAVHGINDFLRSAERLVDGDADTDSDNDPRSRR